MNLSEYESATWRCGFKTLTHHAKDFYLSHLKGEHSSCSFCSLIGIFKIKKDLNSFSVFFIGFGFWFWFCLLVCLFVFVLGQFFFFCRSFFFPTWTSADFAPELTVNQAASFHRSRQPFREDRKHYSLHSTTASFLPMWNSMPMKVEVNCSIHSCGRHCFSVSWNRLPTESSGNIRTASGPSCLVCSIGLRIDESSNYSGWLCCTACWPCVSFLPSSSSGLCLQHLLF